ncbi:hypothetical protein ACFLYT_00655 [Nanoarchaeota archaeon]
MEKEFIEGNFEKITYIRYFRNNYKKLLESVKKELKNKLDETSPSLRGLEFNNITDNFSDLDLLHNYFHERVGWDKGHRTVYFITPAIHAAFLYLYFKNKKLPLKEESITKTLANCKDVLLPEVFFIRRLFYNHASLARLRSPIEKLTPEQYLEKFHNDKRFQFFIFLFLDLLVKEDGCGEKELGKYWECYKEMEEVIETKFTEKEIEEMITMMKGSDEEMKGVLI